MNIYLISDIERILKLSSVVPCIYFILFYLISQNQANETCCRCLKEFYWQNKEMDELK